MDIVSRFFMKDALSRPYRDAGLLVVLSRHCEDSVLLYRVMKGLVPIGTGHDASIIVGRAPQQGHDTDNTVQATGRSAVIVARLTIRRPDRDAICITRYKLHRAQCRESSMTDYKASRQGRDMHNTVQAPQGRSAVTAI